MEKLNLPEFSATIRTGPSGKDEIFDRFRKRYVRLTPEEWVRQHFLNYMTSGLGFPASMIVVEARLKYNNMIRRFDILAYRPDKNPCMVVECKAPTVEVTQAVFDQAAMYNMTLQADFMVVTNGLTHYACRIDHNKKTYAFLKEIPNYNLLKP